MHVYKERSIFYEEVRQSNQVRQHTDIQDRRPNVDVQCNARAGPTAAWFPATQVMHMWQMYISVLTAASSSHNEA
jgi:hypothetical protein